MKKQYDGEIFRIETKDGDKYSPGITINTCDGLAVTMAGFGRFTITHIPSGRRVCNGNYERCDNAILEMVRLAMIAKANGFSWSDKNPQQKIKEVADRPVPFGGATITDKDGIRPMTIGRYISTLKPHIPFFDIDTPPWEELSPIAEAEKIMGDGASRMKYKIEPAAHHIIDERDHCVAIVTALEIEAGVEIELLEKVHDLESWRNVSRAIEQAIVSMNISNRE